MSRPAALLLTFLVAVPVGAAERFVIDGEHSRIGFSVAYDFMVLLSEVGQFDQEKAKFWTDVQGQSAEQRAISFQINAPAKGKSRRRRRRRRPRSSNPQ